VEYHILNGLNPISVIAVSIMDFPFIVFILRVEYHRLQSLDCYYCHVAKTSHLILFADDTTKIFVAARQNLNNLICNTNKELHLISEWLQVNKILLNVSKTSFVLFLSPKNVMTVMVMVINQITINGMPIRRYCQPSFLAENLDEHLTWIGQV